MILKYPVNYIMVVEYFEAGVHNGMDLGWGTYQSEDEPVFSPGDGEVVGVRNDYNQTDSSGGSYGNFVKIKHSDTIYSLCAHLKYKSVMVSVGDKVKMGDKIGIMGMTGHAYKIHVHYEVFENGKKVNPILYTYVFKDQRVSSNPEYSKDLLYYNEEDKDIETLKKMIEQLENQNGELLKEIENLKKENETKINEINNLKNEITELELELQKYGNIIFSFDVEKTSLYLIKLYKNERLYISS